MAVQCFMIEVTDRVWRYLRRYRGAGDGGECHAAGNGGYHHAMVQIEDGPLVRTEYNGFTTEPHSWPHDDPRWPTACACGYAFRENDEWQLFYLPIFKRPDTGDEYTIHPSHALTAPPGAMFYSDWHTYSGFVGPDGRSLSVITPGGQWDIDFPSSRSGGHWSRSGTPPVVTANPSIHIIGRYHGWLRDGQLVEA